MAQRLDDKAFLTLLKAVKLQDTMQGSSVYLDVCPVLVRIVQNVCVSFCAILYASCPRCPFCQVANTAVTSAGAQRGSCSGKHTHSIYAQVNRPHLLFNEL